MKYAIDPNTRMTTIQGNAGVGFDSVEGDTELFI